MRENEIKPGNWRHDVSAALLFVVGTLFGISTALWIFRDAAPPDEANLWTNLLVSLIGWIGALPLLGLSLAFVAFATKAFLARTPLALGRHVVGPAALAIGFSLVLGAIFAGQGGELGRAVPAAIGGLFGALAGVALGLVIAGLSCWLFWGLVPVRPRAAPERGAGDLADALARTSGDGVSSAELTALAPPVPLRPAAQPTPAVAVQTAMHELRARGGIPEGARPLEPREVEGARPRPSAAAREAVAGPFAAPASMPPTPATPRTPATPTAKATGATPLAPLTPLAAPIGDDGPAEPFTRPFWESGSTATPPSARARRASGEGAEPARPALPADDPASLPNWEEIGPAERSERTRRWETPAAGEEGFDWPYGERQSSPPPAAMGHATDEDLADEPPALPHLRSAPGDADAPASTDEESLQPSDPWFDAEAAALERADGRGRDAGESTRSIAEEQMLDEALEAPPAPVGSPRAGAVDSANAADEAEDEWFVPEAETEAETPAPAPASPAEPDLFSELEPPAAAAKIPAAERARTARPARPAAPAQAAPKTPIDPAAEPAGAPSAERVAEPATEPATEPTRTLKPAKRSRKEPTPPALEREVVLDPAPAASLPPGTRERLVREAGCLIVEQQRVAVSMLQRKFQLDFDQATALLDELQTRGLIGPYLGGTRRDILLSRDEWMARAEPS